MTRVAAALLLLAAGCASTGARVLERGVLAYDVAAAGDLVATIELETDFVLVLRRPGSAIRVPLGPPDYDMVDLALDRAGRTAAIAGRDGTIRIHDARSGRERLRFRLDAAATAVALSDDGAYLATGAASGVLCLRRVADGALLQCVAAYTHPVRALAAAGDRLASVDAAGGLIVWRLPSLAVLERRALGGPATAVAFAPDGRVVAAGPPVAALAVAPDGRLLRARSDGVLDDGRRRLAAFRGPLRGLALSPDGATVYVAGFTSRDLRGRSLTAIPLR